VQGIGLGKNSTREERNEWGSDAGDIPAGRRVEAGGNFSWGVGGGREGWSTPGNKQLKKNPRASNKKLPLILGERPSTGCRSVSEVGHTGGVLCVGGFRGEKAVGGKTFLRDAFQRVDHMGTSSVGDARGEVKQSALKATMDRRAKGALTVGPSRGGLRVKEDFENCEWRKNEATVG